MRAPNGSVMGAEAAGEGARERERQRERERERERNIERRRRRTPCSAVQSERKEGLEGRIHFEIVHMNKK
jgi:hypothetical protein